MDDVCRQGTAVDLSDKTDDHFPTETTLFCINIGRAF